MHFRGRNRALYTIKTKRFLIFKFPTSQKQEVVEKSRRDSAHHTTCKHSWDCEDIGLSFRLPSLLSSTLTPTHTKKKSLRVLLARRTHGFQSHLRQQSVSQGQHRPNKQWMQILAKKRDRSERQNHSVQLTR